MQIFVDNILLIFILPIVSAIICFVAQFYKFFISKKIVTTISLFANLVGLIFSIALYYFYSINILQNYENSINWFRLGDLNLSLGIYIDNISIIFLLILMIVSILVQWYSASYMENEQNYNLYFCFLNLFNFSMIALILSSNLVQTYICWELVGVCSYLLVNFYFDKTKVSDSAKNVFIINRIGDMMFLAGIVIFVYFIIMYPISEGVELLAFSNISQYGSDFYVYLSDNIFFVVCLLLFGGIIAKSAQFPMHVWLIDAMQAPTPVSAFIHSATMVAAGVFLSVRLLPLFQLSEMFLQTMIYIGMVTAFFCAFFAIAQNNIKKMLAYSTSSQLGIMIASIGVLAPASAMFYFVSHAFSKALLFLIAGILIKYISDEVNDIECLGGIRKKYPLLAICYLVAIISISGVFFSGFYAKEMTLNNFIALNNPIIFSLFVLVLFMTSYYLFKSYFLIFEGNKSECKNTFVPLNLQIPIVLLSILIIAVTFLPKDILVINNFSSEKTAVHNIELILTSVLISVMGIILAYCVVYNKKKPLPEVLRLLSLNGGYISNFYVWVVDNVFDIFRNLVKIIDKYVFNLIGNSQGYVARFISWCICVSQNGNIQTYLAYSVVIIGILLMLYLLLFVGIGEILYV